MPRGRVSENQGVLIDMTSCIIYEFFVCRDMEGINPLVAYCKNKDFQGVDEMEQQIRL